ncbi:ThuA domain-containing protein [Pedobacter immunditicola]|uniref:ThuA domain-containing protein n=1 Tax=Pedobacter immunditicola TaxID=3133440 RepID=UPI003097A241
MNAKAINLSGYFLIILMMLSSAGIAQQSKKILVFSKTSGFHHKSIVEGNAALLQMGKENSFEVDTTTNAGNFTKENLSQYAAVVFLNTTGDVLNPAQEQAFEQYIKSGKGFVGIHAASDTEFDWPWYGNLVGAYFVSHPKQQVATLNIVNRKTIATRHLPKEWKLKEEWYNFNWMTKEKLNVLITIDEKSYDPGANKMGDYHPIAWYHDFDGGRSFYTELGHTEEAYADPLFLKHVLGGIQYAMGLKKM